MDSVVMMLHGAYCFINFTTDEIVTKFVGLKNSLNVYLIYRKMLMVVTPFVLKNENFQI